jgi:hypothetical protein
MAIWFGPTLRRFDRNVARECRLCSTPEAGRADDPPTRVTKEIDHCACGPMRQGQRAHHYGGRSLPTHSALEKRPGTDTTPKTTRHCRCGAEGLFTDEAFAEHLDADRGEEGCQELLYVCLCQQAFTSIASRGAHMGSCNRSDPGIHVPFETSSAESIAVLSNRLYCSCACHFPNETQRAEHHEEFPEHEAIPSEEGMRMIQEASLLRFHRRKATGPIEDYSHLCQCPALKEATEALLPEGLAEFDTLDIVLQAALLGEFRSLLKKRGLLTDPLDGKHHSL